MHDEPGEREVTVAVPLAVVGCDRCGETFSYGASACPSCGGRCDVLDPLEQGINKVRWEALGDLISELEAITDTPEREEVRGPVLTDEQFINFINRNSIISAELVDDVRAVLDDMDLGSKNSIRSTPTRKAFERLIANARDVRGAYDELTGVRVPERFETLHVLIVAVYYTILDLYRAGGRAVLAVTIEELSAAQRALQGALDRGAGLGSLMSAELEGVDLVGLDPSISRRLALLTGRPGRYEYEGQLDPAAVLASALQQSITVEDLGKVALAEFPRTLTSGAKDLTPDQGLALYLLAAEVAASPDPMTLRRRANVFLAILNEAYARDQVAMSAMVEAAAPDVEDAMVNLLAAGELLRRLDSALSTEAIRMELSGAYDRLSEWIFRRLANVLVAAKHVIDQDPKAYADIAHMSSNEKFNALSQAKDPRYAVALHGVVTVTRNAGAHGDVDLSGDKVHLRAVDRKRGLVREEWLTEGEFADRLLDLLLTCLALSLSYHLFCLEHARDLPSTSPSSKPRVLSEAARALVGLWGLRRVQVRAGDTAAPAVVEAADDPERPARDSGDFLAAAATLATLFRQWPDLSLRITRDGTPLCRLTVPTEVAVEFLSLPAEAQPFGALKLRYLSLIEPRIEDDDVERYRREWIRDGARLVAQQVAELNPLRNGLPKTKSEYEAAVRSLSESAERFRQMLLEVPVPPAARSPRDRLFAALGMMENGLARHLNLLASDQWNDVKKGSEMITRAVTRITDLMME
jgi:hypothetical protein